MTLLERKTINERISVHAYPEEFVSPQVTLDATHPHLTRTLGRKKELARKIAPKKMPL